MSDEDRDVDVESDEEDEQSTHGDSIPGDAGQQFQSQPQPGSGQAEKRAHHNALERKRRDHIKDSFHSLRDSVPSLHGEKASRAQILKQATDYITFMTKKNGTHQSDIDDLKKQNNLLEQQVRALEKAKAAGTFASQAANLDTRLVNPKGGSVSAFDGGSDSDSSSSELEDGAESRRKKLKTS